VANWDRGRKRCSRSHFVPGLFDVDEPTAGGGRVVVEVLASSVNEFDRAAARGSYSGQAGR